MHLGSARFTRSSLGLMFVTVRNCQICYVFVQTLRPIIRLNRIRFSSLLPFLGGDPFRR